MSKKRKKRPATSPLIEAPMDLAREVISGWIHARRRWVCVMAARAGDVQSAAAVGLAGGTLGECGFDCMLGRLPDTLIAVCSVSKLDLSGPEFLRAVGLVTGLEVPARFDDDARDLIVVAEVGPAVFGDLLAWVDGGVPAAPLTDEQERKARAMVEGAA
jgi:hypothetical protein